MSVRVSARCPGAPLSDRKKSHNSCFRSTFIQLRVQFQFYLSLFVICGQSGWRKRLSAARRCVQTRGVKCLLSQGFIKFSCPSRKSRRSVLHLERKTNRNLSSDLWSPARCPDRGEKTQDVQIHTVKRQLWPSYSYHSQHGKTFIAFNPTFRSLMG